MGASQAKSGDVPTSSKEIGGNIMGGIVKSIAGEGTDLNKALRLSEQGKALDQRMAGDMNLGDFFGSKSGSSGIADQGYGARMTTKSLRGKYLGVGAASADDVGITEG